MENRHAASVAWNIGYDAGTGLGALMLGVAAHVATFSAGFTVLSALMALAGPAVLLTGRNEPLDPQGNRGARAPRTKRPSLGKR
ncbi:hypothetical protein [Streptomyces sp. NPDC094466]|uniref:hypothetical protein n=1 Tax=Streptomyces sp. NPDC094466 TaxID=3366065 RepID=UPI00381D6162